ncbi:chemotaxis protein CheX [Actinosynnema pretiosum]|uniref:Chemotaxis protein CheX n=1 Tax=Actinosynnema pretiosum TaxID=42197 RepID=A0A290Z4K7_9PSEU|nr:chemotaxis protein CheX [Actinosynnema pretiosum]ATE53893.1 chemotaxis protein CheX [Actinosynnema pretiosum]
MTLVLPTTEDLGSMTEQVWSAYLDPETEHPLLFGDLGPNPVELTASVSIVGAWDGHLVVSTSKAGAQDVASVMLMMSHEELTDDDVSDALGELANVVGGNVKSLVPSPAKLSLPRVGAADSERWPGAVELCRTVVQWKGQPFSVVLFSSSKQEQDSEELPV